MKTFVSELVAAFGETRLRRNLGALFKLLAVQTTLIVAFAGGFKLVMKHVEGQEHSWITSIYWTLTVMSTLGFGDITFHTDTGRVFSIFVLLTGIVMLMIVLPFAFIRFFYAPWLEAQLKLRVARAVPPKTTGHVLFARYDSVAADLIPLLQQDGIPYFIIESNPATAAELHGEELSVIAGEVDSRRTFELARAEHALLVFANHDDRTNTNITLTVREHDAKVPVVALAEHEDSIDVLELAGATTVLPLKQQLGEQLAGRANVGKLRAHVVGRYRDLTIAEFPVHNTELAGLPIRETRLRELTGVNIVAYWERGALLPARADAVLGDYAVPVVVGNEEQMAALDTMLEQYRPNENPVIIIGGGKVGRAVAETLRASGVRTHLIEKITPAARELDGVADLVIVGDAADRAVLTDAGIDTTPAVVLTTNDDATNIFLALYCRRLNPDARVVSRINHSRNIEAIHRAGADLVLSYSSVGSRSLLAMLRRQDLILLGEGADLFVLPTPDTIAGKTLAEVGIGRRTGLNVIAIEHDGEVTTNPPASSPLFARGAVVAIGTPEQCRTFNEAFDG